MLLMRACFILITQNKVYQAKKNCYVVLVHINKQSLRIDNEIMGYGAQQNSSWRVQI